MNESELSGKSRKPVGGRDAEVYGRLLLLGLEVDLEFPSLAGLTVERRAGDGGGESKEKRGPSRVSVGRVAARRALGAGCTLIWGHFIQTDTVIKPPQMCIQSI